VKRLMPPGHLLAWRLAGVLLAACAAQPVEPHPIGKPATEVPMSEPDEYDIASVSRDAGERIFAVTGVGDPYKTGIPYPMFLALLRQFPQQLGDSPQALADRFGFIARAADPTSKDPDVRAGLPVGMHLTIDPYTTVPFVVTSCALCHAGKIGDTIVVGLANRTAKIHAYDRAFADITTQHGFSADHLARLAQQAADANHVAWPERWRDVLVGATVGNLVTRAQDRAELHARTRLDPPGRVATIDSFVLPLHQLTGRDVRYAPDVGWAKIPDVIGFAQRTTLSWDGGGEGSMDLLAVEADIGAGVRVAWLERHPFQGASLGAYLRQPAPRPVFPGTIDRGRAERGHKLFEDNCSACHGHYDGRVDYREQVVALADVGTDPARAMAATDSFVMVANDPTLTRGYTKFRRTEGYVPPVLVNVWARAPYGHAGQWPSLAVLATPPDKRARKYTVAYGAPYDLDAVGLSTAPHGAGDYAYDADRPGFSVAGHPFLADLGDDARDVIEYLKTL
jgi:hypothetical protein